MSITHIPANDWATAGARLEKCMRAEFARRDDDFIAWVKLSPDGLLFAKTGATPLEALTAALDAAKENPCPTSEPT